MTEIKGKNNNINNIKRDKTDIYKTMFNHQLDLLKELGTSIKNNRDVNNYIITGILIFTGFLLDNENLSTLRLSCIGIFLVIILLYWINAYKLTNTKVGLNTLEASEIAYQVNSKGEPYFNNTEDYWLHMVKEVNRIYNLSKVDINKFNNKRKTILRLAVIYLGFTLLLRIMPNILLDIHTRTFIL